MNTEIKTIIAKSQNQGTVKQPISRADVNAIRDFVNDLINTDQIQAATGFQFTDRFLPANTVINTLNDDQAKSLMVYIEKNELQINDIFIQPCPPTLRYPRVITYAVLNEMFEFSFSHTIESFVKWNLYILKEFLLCLCQKLLF